MKHKDKKKDQAEHSCCTYSEARSSQVRQWNARMKQTTARTVGTLTKFRFVLKVDYSQLTDRKIKRERDRAITL